LLRRKKLTRLRFAAQFDFDNDFSRMLLIDWAGLGSPVRGSFG
jgi:hypothetical protein